MLNNEEKRNPNLQGRKSFVGHSLAASLKKKKNVKRLYPIPRFYYPPPLFFSLLKHKQNLFFFVLTLVTQI